MMPTQGFVTRRGDTDGATKAEMADAIAQSLREALEMVGDVRVFTLSFVTRSKDGQDERAYMINHTDCGDCLHDLLEISLRSVAQDFSGHEAYEDHDHG